MSQAASLQSYESKPTREPVTRWLLMVAGLIVLLVVVGGFTRLSRAGLSIVEWNVLSGVAPPMGDAGWNEVFADYQQSPEYQLVNKGMSLEAFKKIFLIEWAHRLIARTAGMFVVLPLLWFMWKKRITVRESLKYWGVVILFGTQGLIGWLMVASGLEDRPAVSHFRLTIHLLTALTLLAIVLWQALDRVRASKPDLYESDRPLVPGARKLTWVTMFALLIQLSWGGLVAGLKAGHVSDTWPLMHGRLIPSNLLTEFEPWWRNFYEPLGSHWAHRWFAIAVAGLVLALFLRIHKTGAGGLAGKFGRWLVWVVLAQVTLGVLTVLFNVNKWVALTHQGVAVVLFSGLVVLCHQAFAQRPAASS